ncbi:MAG: EFR1 family ferrodoxin [Termitinemataceae bacterium]|nr:MAG: EFR1 family ferrodoxin [Termitinemataceae bacterium]
MTKIFYFSGTGNTYWSAKEIAEKLGDAEIIPMHTEIKKQPLRIEADALVFMFPAYAYGMPLIARRFLIKAEIQAPYIAALVTYGSSPGGALGEAKRLLARKKIKLNYAARIPAVENYIPIFGAQSIEKQKQRLAMQTSANEKEAAAIRSRVNKNVSAFKPFSSFVSTLFSTSCSKMNKLFNLSSECNACGLCARICPADAIAMSDDGKGPVFKNCCEQCQACLNFCPKKAINFGRMKKHTERYHHPKVNWTDL